MEDGCQEECHGIGLLGIKLSVQHVSARARARQSCEREWEKNSLCEEKNNLEQRSMAHFGYESSFTLNYGFVRQK